MAGERKSVTELDRTVEYTYHSLYRLTSETITEGEKVTAYTYAYDNVSNRILKTENGAETEYVYNALNQLVSDSETTYEYDLNGNLIRVIGTANSALYEYNSENKLVKATVQNGVLVTEESYTYDYQGNRTSKTTYKSNGEFEYVKYLNDNSSLTNVLAEIDENGTAKCVYTIGADLVSQERNGKVSVYIYDGHGSVVGLANENGAVTDTYSYDAFGNLLKSTGSTKNCYRYCGEQFDESTGLYYLRARYMDTSTGRFISQDSYAGSISDPTSLHKYLYANANPVMYSDPSGYETFKGLKTALVIEACLLETILCTTMYLNILRDVKSTTSMCESSMSFKLFPQMALIKLASLGYEAINIVYAKSVVLKNLTKIFRDSGQLNNLMTFILLISSMGQYILSRSKTVSPKEPNRMVVHHIVPKKHGLAFPARFCLIECGVDVWCGSDYASKVNTESNLVQITERTHLALHSDSGIPYCLWINAIIVPVYIVISDCDEDERYGVMTCLLDSIGMELKFIDNVSNPSAFI